MGSQPGRSIELYYGINPPSSYSSMMDRPKESMGDAGAFVIMSGLTPLIVAPESSYLFNYDLIQYMSPIRSLTRKMPIERQQLSKLDEHLLRLATVAYSKLKK